MQPENERVFVEQRLREAFKNHSMESRNQALVQELVYGILRQQSALDWIIDLKTDGRRQPSLVRMLLRLGIYQLFWLSRVPAHAAVHETVQLAKKSKASSHVRFLNAVLRSCEREKDTIQKSLDSLIEKQPWIPLSHPQWLYERWAERWGSESAKQLMISNNTPPKTFARVNTLRTSAEELQENWKKEGIEFRSVDCDWAGDEIVFELESHPVLTSLNSFNDGGFYIQDPSTLLSVDTLNPQAHENILDLCAAPGGKTTYIAQLMQNEATVVAYDISGKRLIRVKENCERLGVSCAKITSDSSALEGAAFDKILIDAPCSNTGVFRRRVDLRWRLKETEIDEQRGTQLELLHQAVKFLKPGGIIVYSTCSIEPDENESVVEEFLKSNPDFTSDFQRTLLPFKDQTDGAFVCRMKKAD